MKAWKKSLLYISSFLLVFFYAQHFSLSYSYVQLEGYLKSLLAVSAMVFTIMGIWIAFLYPNALRKIVNPSKVEYADFGESLSETKRLEGLVGSVLRSSFVVVVIMLVFLGKILLQPALINFDVGLVKSISVSLVVVITLLQFESIYYVMYSNVMFINELHSKREEREADEDV
ncbi:hypothetical protein [Halomonas sp. M4R1S46]|uniref:hypothetical protein n=1 Tax=Halomonas sp. M4R1S46 TaxID=2982692 RepID=UPI0021E50232|nr:hypothetical protein [Halomonas sp. M4R1S46]UYG08295.1 hypothetical protein OCT48_02835 [Halomonas sp. M4R1S46]